MYVCVYMDMDFSFQICWLFFFPILFYFIFPGANNLQE